MLKYFFYFTINLLILVINFIMKNKISKNLKHPETIIIILMVLLLFFSFLLIFNLRSNAISNFFSGKKPQSPETVATENKSSSFSFAKQKSIDTTLFADTGQRVVVNKKEGISVLFEPCENQSPLIRRFGSYGVVQSGAVIKECDKQTKVFYEVKWYDDTISFVDSESVDITTKIVENGQVNGVVGFADFNPKYKVCGVDLIKKIEFCNNPSVNPKQGESVEYKIELPVGTYYVYAQLIDLKEGFDKVYFNNCVFEGSTLKNKVELCKEDTNAITPVKISIVEKEIVNNINLTDYRQNIKV